MRLHPRAVRLLPLLLPILLLPLGQKAFGQPCTPSPQPVSDFPGPGSRIREMAAVGSTLFLSVQDDTNDYGLWKLEEGQSSLVLLDRSSSPGSVLNLSNLTVVGQRLFFVIHVEMNNNNLLWATDEAHTSISQVGTVAFPGNSVRDQGELTVLGSSLYIRGNNGQDELRLWWSDGTSVQAVTDGAGNEVLDPSKPVAMGGKLFFAAADSQAGKELWVIESAGGPARRLKDLWPGNLSSNPASLTVMGGKLYFTATTPGQDASLWVSDGSEGGTEIVAGPETLGSSHGTPSALTAAGDQLFFHMAQIATGDELWVSDGTTANTRMVEIHPGGSGSDPDQLTAVGSMLFFIANNATSGREPWRSDGTAAGTFMVREFVDGSSNSFETPELKAGPGVLLLSIYTAASGKELWSASDTDIVQLSDIVSGTESSTPHALTIVGNKLYFAAGPTGPDDGLYWLPLTQVDCRKPSVTCPGPLQIEAVSPQGAYVFLPPPVQMSDDSFTPLTVSYSPSSFERFDLDNSTPATITVRDMAGNEETCSVTINVQDTRGPELVCPASLVVEATGPDGANVSYPVEAWDAVSGVSSVSAAPPSGSHFRLGQEAQVMVTAEDGKRNPTTCEFSVTVKDTLPPKLICPRDIVVVATSAEPVPVTYAPLLLEDATGATLLENEHPSGSLFEVLKGTEVTLRAVDAQSHLAECTFSVYVVDPVAPTLTCPGPQQAVATGPEGAAVEFPEASAEDALGPPTLRYSAESGSTFPVGETTVTATATDRGRNEASCSFTVTVTGPGQEVPAAGCACRSGSASASVYWLLLALAPLWARRRIGRLAR